MRQYPLINSTVALLILGTSLGSCSVKKATLAPKQEKTQIATFSKGDLTYEIYRQSAFNQDGESKVEKNNEILRLTIRLVNKAGNTSPLRAISRNYEEYNIHNEYLLNGARNDIMLCIQQQYLFPKYYSFENNYNAFPFETINVGYVLGKKQKHKPIQLIFVDKIFTRDSIFFNLNSK